MINALTGATVLFIGPTDEHQMALSQILGNAKLQFCSRAETGVSRLRDSRIPIVLCDSEVDWRGVLDYLKGIQDPPCLIVTSRLADDRLWSEALNLGAYDVLAKPFDKAEVSRVLSMAASRCAEESAQLTRRISRRDLAMHVYA